MQQKINAIAPPRPGGRLAARPWLLLALMAAAGYIMSNSFIFGGTAPFGAAFCAALSWKYVSAAALGAVLGHTFSLGSVTDMKYIAAILLVAVLKWALAQKLLRIPRGIDAIACAFFGMASASVLLIATMEATLYDMLRSFAELMLCCGAAYFFSRSAVCLSTGFVGAARSGLSCVVVSFSIVVMGFSGILIGGVSVGRVIAILVILLAARHAKEAGGAIAGVVAGISMGISGGDFAYLVSAYSLGGLLCGVFSRAGRLAAASVFVIVNAIAAIFVGSSVDAYAAVIELFIASACFIALPDRVLKKLRLPSLPDVPGEGGAARFAFRQRMDEVSRTLRQVGQATREAGRRFGKPERGDPASLCARIAARVCKRCGMKTSCWQERHADTMNALTGCVHTLRRGGTLNREQLPASFAKACIKADSVIGELNAQFQHQLSRESVTRKVSQIRSVISDQFDGMAGMIDELAADLANRTFLPEDQCLRIRGYFERNGIESDRLFCYLDGGGRSHIELRIPAYQLARLERLSAALELSGLLETEFDCPETETEEGSARVVFSEKATLAVEIGAFQLCRGGNRLCGDSYETPRDRAGRQHLILSDGMGSGGSAAVDSAMASGLIARLLGAGIGHQAALGLVNSALLTKSGDESLATVDVCTINLFTGEAGFYKAGAAPSCILRDGKPRLVTSASLPAGILRGVAFEQTTLSLRAGDLVLMVSDGCTATGAEWLLSEMKSAGKGDIRQLCEGIAATAAARHPGKQHDDITVIAVRLTDS